jgi:hypothetical protein
MYDNAAISALPPQKYRHKTIRVEPKD